MRFSHSGTESPQPPTPVSGKDVSQAEICCLPGGRGRGRRRSTGIYLHTRSASWFPSPALVTMMLPGRGSFRVWWSRDRHACIITKDTEAHRQEVPDPPSAQASGMLLAECAALLASVTRRGRTVPVNEHLLRACHVRSTLCNSPKMLTLLFLFHS